MNPVLVADELLRTGEAAISCPAGDLLAGELRRRGVATFRGPIRLDVAPDERVLAAVVPGTASGLGVATAYGDDEGWLAAWSASASWLSVAGSRTVLLASPRSFCAGVERAIEVVERTLQQRTVPIYVRRQIVHNTHVVADLETRGAVFVDELDAVPDGATVVFSAHGVAPSVRDEAARRSLDVIDATCPLVAKVHAEARRFAGRGDTVILIGHAGHDEIEGTLGEAPERTILVESVAEVASVQVADQARVSYLTQTTLALDETAAIIDALRARFPEIRGPASEDICYATTNRQNALTDVAAAADLVLVVGSDNSSNSRRLVEVAHRHGAAAHLVDEASDIRPEWLRDARVVGVTAGASAPPRLVDGVVAALAGLGPVSISESGAVEESVTFTMPPGIRTDPVRKAP
jgi:4-hydroxy-3-methylbut-2-en-1-yl diphosphate reductase